MPLSLASDMRVLLVLAKFSVGAKPEVCGSSIELRMTVGPLRVTSWGVEAGRILFRHSRL